MQEKRILTRTVILLSVVSLLTDVASEMLYPIMPLYLDHIGFSVLMIGILEGVAEATAGLSKGFFGKMSDDKGRKVPFVQWGYSLSAMAKPLMAVFTYPLWVFGARTLERLGKGIRTGARDALLAAEANTHTKGRVFGFHRAVDTLGAAIGPALAIGFLTLNPENYQALFLWSAVPGVLAVATTLMLREKIKKAGISAGHTSFFDFIRYVPRSPRDYRFLLAGLLGFTLFNSSDLFLLMMLKHNGTSDTMIIGAYIFYNISYALTAYPGGQIADRFGLKRTYIAGVIIFALVYFGMAHVTRWEGFLILFFLYALYASATEGIAKAWISNIVGRETTATAIGTFEAFRSICTMIASAFAGFLWSFYSPQTTFLVTAIGSLFIAGYVWVIPFQTVFKEEPGE